MSALTIREPVETDICALQPVFQQTIRDRDTGAFILTEAEEVKNSIRSSIAGESTQHFLVAEEAGSVLGIMGIQPPDEGMKQFVETPKPMELITALVLDEARGKGVGRALVSALTERAVTEGSTELIVNSGPRYEKSGWPFWKRLFGKPVGVAKDYYGRGGDAMVWRKYLKNEVKEPVVINTERDDVTLRELTTPQDDVEYFEAIEEDRKHIDNHGNRAASKYPTVNEVRQARERAGDKLRFGIWADGRFVGTINATPNEGKSEVEIGYFLRKSAVGHGYATIALKALTDYLTPQYKRVFAEVNVRNKNSANVLLRAGYRKSGEVDRDWGRMSVFER